MEVIIHNESNLKTRGDYTNEVYSANMANLA